ncbi:hypothetical protein F4679DRAFT_70859 [Xylaria curta]|nr:hypothetical protein F4679DRAFT_70859 [Xylaria curta]
MASAWSASNSSNDYTIHVGIWTNWDRGSVLGKTLTLSKDDAATLISFTALFITFIASRFWFISSFIFHQCYATAEPRDGLHHQRQAILRNATSALYAFEMLFSMQSAWRRRAKRRLYRALPLMAFSLICTIAFTAASGLSSWITKAPGEAVLVRSSSCGYVALDQNLEPSKQLGALSVLDPYFANQAVQAETYAEQCYLSNAVGLLDCAGFVQDRLAATIDNNADCPFDEEICVSKNGNLVLDSGFIDSHKDLGLNAPTNSRIQMRTVLQCAPLKTRGYTEQFSDETGNYTRYLYGVGAESDTRNTTTTNTRRNATDIQWMYKVKDLASQYSGGYVGAANYLLSYSAYLPINGEEGHGAFLPRDELYRTDGDTYIFFLVGNGVLYWDPVDAPWYQAHTPGPNIRSTVGEGGLLATYIPDEAASPVACVEQFQFCNTAYPGETGCGPLGGSFGSVVGAAPLFNTSYKELGSGNTTTEAGSRLLWFINQQTTSATVAHIVRTLGPRGLASQSKLYQGVQPTLPKEQWQLDMTQIWASSLAGLQAIFLTTAQGQTDEELQPYRALPWDGETQHLCNSQKMRSAQYTSFSLFGLLFTFVTGALIIGISFLVEPVAKFLCKRDLYSQYNHLEWGTNSVLQLQRLGYEGVPGTETVWRKCTSTVPVTESDILMDPLDVSDSAHPTLARAVSMSKDSHKGSLSKGYGSESSL